MAAEFTISDTAFETLEYEAEHDEVLELALEDGTGLDASTVTYSVVLASDDAPALTFSPSTGIPTTPTGIVTATMPSTGTHSWRIQCQINNGYDSSGRWNSTYTKERIVSIRSPNLGLRKQVPGETTQAHVSGWTVAQNEMVDALDNFGGLGHGDLEGGSLHELASSESAGFMSPEHFDVVEAISDDVTNGSTRYWEIVCGGANLTTGATRYFAPPYDSAQTNLVRWRATRACTAVAMTYTNLAGGTGTGTITMTLCKVVADATVDTSLTMTFSPSVRDQSVAGSVAIAQGDDIVIKATTTGTISSSPQNPAFAVGFTA